MKRYLFLKMSNNSNNIWFYAQLYCNELHSNEILLLVKNFIPLKKPNAEWFFIRYSHPYYHLRIRIKTSNENEKNDLFNGFKKMRKHNPYIISKIKKAEYKPEKKKYSLFPIKLSEELFILDTKIQLKLLEESQENKLIFNTIFTFQFLKSFKFSDDEIINLSNSILPFFYKEYSEINNLRKEVSKKYKTLYKKIDINLRFDNDLRILLVNKSNFIENNLIGKAKNRLNQFVLDHIHMNTNRIFINNQKLFELFTYEFLIRRLKTKKYFEKVS